MDNKPGGKKNKRKKEKPDGINKQKQQTENHELMLLSHKLSPPFAETGFLLSLTSLRTGTHADWLTRWNSHYIFPVLPWTEALVFLSFFYELFLSKSDVFKFFQTSSRFLSSIGSLKFWMKGKRLTINFTWRHSQLFNYEHVRFFLEQITWYLQ